MASSQLLEALCRAAVCLNQIMQRQQLAAAEAAGGSSNSRRSAALDSLLRDLRAVHQGITLVRAALQLPCMNQQCRAHYR